MSSSLVDVLREHAASRPDDRAYVFLADRGGEQRALTFGQLERRARAIGARLARRADPGDRAVLVFPPGLEFIEGFLGCLHAGLVAVPLVPPRRHRLRESIASVLADCTPRLALTVPALVDPLRAELGERFGATEIGWVAVDDAPGLEDADPGPPARRSELALLQYTSGSTSTPKGVMVTHANLLANLEMARVAFGCGPRSTYVSWVPLHHDMGLILNVLASLYAGAACVLMAPVSFMQRPLAWLRAIHDYRADVAGAPNFAYDLCVKRFRADHLAGLDLSGWKVAFNGAEPVHGETIERFVETYAPYGFAPAAVYPCYGMAEATVLISAGRRGTGPVTRVVSRAALREHVLEPARHAEDAHVLVGCGKALPGERLAIVDPSTRERVAAGSVGEIWVRGPNVGRGYWDKPEETAASFQARIEGDGDAGWLRTGDLGWLDEEGELYPTGRLKDVIIIRGGNFYPQDIERTVENSHPALRPHRGAAFSVPGDHGEERLVIVQEVERAGPNGQPLDDVVAAIRAAVVREYELTIHKVVLIRAGTIPVTSSGKIQRRLTRQRWREGALEVLDEAGERPAALLDDAAVAPGSRP